MSSYVEEKSLEGGAYQDFIGRVAEARGKPLHFCTTYKDQVEIGENHEGVEIKYASGLYTYNGIWVEIEEKTEPTDLHWRRSGILRKDNTKFFASGNYYEIWVFPIYHIQEAYYTGPYKVKTIKRGTSRGFYLPIEDFEKYKGRRMSLAPYRHLMTELDAEVESRASRSPGKNHPTLFD